MAQPAPTKRNEPLNVEWSNIVRFIRQVSHDLRNHLNAAELQAAYVNELVSDLELTAEIKRLREMISVTGKALQNLSARLGQVRPNLMPYRAADFVADLRTRIDKEFPDKKTEVRWDAELGDTMLEIDPQLLPQAFVELLANAFEHERGNGEIGASAKIDNGRFVFALREPKKDFGLALDNWGREPFRGVRPGHYGLGLNLARAIVDAHHGELHAQFDSAGSSLVTTVVLPISK
jgi:K+-sensing histidine kinase KdpD